MGTTLNPSTVASSGMRERFGSAPIASQHRSGLPFAGHTAVTAAVTATVTATAALTYAAPQLAAVRKDDARVPDPRGRQR